MKLNIKEIAVFGMLGGLMYASKVLMDVLPNVHLIGTFIVALTVVYRKKALFPIYVFVLLTGLFGGFAPWWVPYIYIWTVLWGAVMLLPRNMPKKLRPVVYMVISTLHGLLYGVLYAPVQALMFGYDLEMTLLWIAAGLHWDLTHGISNFICGTLIIPLANTIQRAERYAAK